MSLRRFAWPLLCAASMTAGASSIPRDLVITPETAEAHGIEVEYDYPAYYISYRGVFEGYEAKATATFIQFDGKPRLASYTYFEKAPDAAEAIVADWRIPGIEDAAFVITYHCVGTPCAYGGLVTLTVESLKSFQEP